MKGALGETFLQKVSPNRAIRRGGGERRDAGFTLIELVIAITLLAAMATIMTGGLALSLRSWEAGKERMEGHYDLTEGLYLLAGQVRMARTAFIVDEKNIRKPAFDGKPEELRFVAGYPRLASMGAADGWHLQKIAYDKETHSITFAESWFQPSGDPEKARWTQTRIGDGKIKSFKLEYLVKEGPDQYVWTDATAASPTRRSNTDELPKAVRISVETEEEKDGFAWPPIEVEIMERAETKREVKKS